MSKLQQLSANYVAVKLVDVLNVIQQTDIELKRISNSAQSATIVNETKRSAKEVEQAKEIINQCLKWLKAMGEAE